MARVVRLSVVRGGTSAGAGRAADGARVDSGARTCQWHVGHPEMASAGETHSGDR
jgi:hypothetical protein